MMNQIAFEIHCFYKLMLVEDLRVKVFLERADSWSHGYFLDR